jgi:hypothetical protein
MQEVLLFEEIFYALSFTTFPNFKVLDIILTVIVHTFHLRRNGQNALEEVFFTFIFFHFFRG